MTRSTTEREDVASLGDEAVGEFLEGRFDRPLISMEEFAANGAGIFKSDEELDDFLALTYDARRRNVG